MATKKTDTKKTVDHAAKAEAIRRAEEALKKMGGEDDLPKTVKTTKKVEPHKEASEQKSHSVHKKEDEKKAEVKEDSVPEETVVSAVEEEPKTETPDVPGASTETSGSWIAQTESNLKQENTNGESDEEKSEIADPEEAPKTDFLIGTSPVLPSIDEPPSGADPTDSEKPEELSTETSPSQTSSDDTSTAPSGDDATSPLFGAEDKSDGTQSSEIPDTAVKDSDNPSSDVFTSFETAGGEEKKGSKKIMIIAGFVVIGLIVGGIVYWFFGRDKMTSTPVTPTITQAPPPPATATPVPLNRDEWTIEVLNGSGVRGAAAEATETLEEMGYEVVNTGNADSSDFESTELHVSADMEEKAQALIDDLQGEFSFTEVTDTYTESTPAARIILGAE